MNSKDITEIANNIVNIFNKSYSEIFREDKDEKISKEDNELSDNDRKISGEDNEKKITNQQTNEKKISGEDNEKKISIKQDEKLPTTTEEIMDNLIQMDREKEKDLNGGVSLDSLVDNLVGGSKQHQIIATQKDISPNLFEGGNREEITKSSSDSSDSDIEDYQDNRYSDFVNEFKNTILQGGDITDRDKEEDLDILPIFPYIISI